MSVDKTFTNWLEILVSKQNVGTEDLVFLITLTLIVLILVMLTRLID